MLLTHSVTSAFAAPCEGCQLEALFPPRPPLLHPDSWLDPQSGRSYGPRNGEISGRMPLLLKNVCSDPLEDPLAV